MDRVCDGICVFPAPGSSLRTLESGVVVAWLSSRSCFFGFADRRFGPSVQVSFGWPVKPWTNTRLRAVSRPNETQEAGDSPVVVDESSTRRLGSRPRVAR